MCSYLHENNHVHCHSESVFDLFELEHLNAESVNAMCKVQLFLLWTVAQRRWTLNPILLLQYDGRLAGPGVKQHDTVVGMTAHQQLFGADGDDSIWCRQQWAGERLEHLEGGVQLCYVVCSMVSYVDVTVAACG